MQQSTQAGQTKNAITPRQTMICWSAATLALCAGAAIGRAQQSPVNAGLNQFQQDPTQAYREPGAGVPGSEFDAPANLPRDPFSGAPDQPGVGSPMAQAGLDPSQMRDPGLPAAPVPSDAVRVNDGNIVDIHINNESLTAVLEMLSIQAQTNIITHKNVAALSPRVSANMYGVTFFEALDALLNANGFGYIQEGNFIYVYTAEDLEKIEQRNRKRVSRVVRLNYINAVDAASFVAPYLSDGSTIKTNGKTENFPGSTEVPIGSDQFASESTLVIFDYEENLNAIIDLLRELDTRPVQVLVEATILQTSLNEANAFGVDFALIGNMNFKDFTPIGGPLSIVDGLIAGNSSSLGSPGSGDTPAPVGAGQGMGLVSSPGNTAGPGTFKIGFSDNDTAVFVKLLDEVSDTTVLSTPRILALNRQAARVLIGERVGYLNSTATDGVVSQTVEFLDTGTQLYFRPFVSSDGLIRMELKPQVSTAVIREVRNSQGALVTVPDEITNELTTNVMVRDGQTIVLGGLFRESTESTRRQVPFIGDIPILGAAFRGHEDDVRRSEIIFLITPSIMSDTVLAESGQKTRETIDRLRTGTREGLLPFSRERMTGQLMIEAEQLLAEGKSDEALWRVNRALSLNPHQADAVGLRERITNKTANWPTRSNFDHILNAEVKSGASAHPVHPPHSGAPAQTNAGTRTGTSASGNSTGPLAAGNSSAGTETYGDFNSTNGTGETTNNAAGPDLNTPSEWNQSAQFDAAATAGSVQNTGDGTLGAASTQSTPEQFAGSPNTGENFTSTYNATQNQPNVEIMPARPVQPETFALDQLSEEQLIDMLNTYDALAASPMSDVPGSGDQDTSNTALNAAVFVSFFTGAYDLFTLSGPSPFPPNAPVSGVQPAQASDGQFTTIHEQNDGQ